MSEAPASVVADAPTVNGAVQTPPDSSAGPPDQPVTDDTPAWKRAASREEALQALLDDEETPLDIVTKHQKVSGHIGTLAKRQARQLVEQDQASAREQRRRELAARGQYTELGQEIAGDIVPDPALAAQQLAHQTLIGEAQSELGTILAKLPKEAQEKLSERATDGAYNNGGFGAGLRTWTEDVIAEMVAAELPKALDKEIKKRDLVPRAVAEAERVNGLGSPDVRRGGAGSTQEYDTEVEMATAFAAGEIDRTQMTAWYRRHRR